MTHERIERVAAPTGNSFDAQVLARDGGGPGILLLPEIYGVGEFLDEKAQLLADLGYLVFLPDVFWRVERNVSLAHDEEALQVALGNMCRFSKVPKDATIADLVAALRHLRTLPDVTGKVAVMGYCLGGRLAYEVAAAPDPDACVSYYGSGIAAELDLAHLITCPALFHFGGSDPYIAGEEVAAVFATRPGFHVVVQEQAGHAFES
jgi:carboxymethylenebutenolidase